MLEQTIPLDVRTMREAALRALGDDAERLSEEDVDSMTQALRGMLMLAVPEVTAAAGRLPKGDIPRVCALVGIEEATRRLGMESRIHTPQAALRHAQRLARSVMALTDHYVNLRGQV